MANKRKNFYIKSPEAWVKAEEITDMLSKEFGSKVSMSDYIEICIKEGNQRREDRLRAYKEKEGADN